MGDDFKPEMTAGHSLGEFSALVAEMCIRDSYKALVFDGTSMGAHLYAAVSILRIGKERNKEYLHALVRHDAAQFGELYIVAYQHALSLIHIYPIRPYALLGTPSSFCNGRKCP